MLLALQVDSSLNLREAGSNSAISCMSEHFRFNMSFSLNIAKLSLSWEWHELIAHYIELFVQPRWKIYKLEELAISFFKNKSILAKYYGIEFNKTYKTYNK